MCTVTRLSVIKLSFGSVNSYCLFGEVDALCKNGGLAKLGEEDVEVEVEIF